MPQRNVTSKNLPTQKRQIDVSRGKLGMNASPYYVTFQVFHKNIHNRNPVASKMLPITVTYYLAYSLS